MKNFILFAHSAMSSGKTKDKFLYTKIKEKDREAFITAYDKYLPDIYRFIYYKVSSKEEAEDIASQTFLRIWDYIQNNELKSYKTLKALLYRVARNLIIDHYRRESTQKKAIYEEDISQLHIVDEKQNLKAAMEIKEDYGLVESKLLELKDEYREVIVLKYINGLSVAEMAEALDKSHGNIRVIVYRAMKALKEIINEGEKK